MPYSKDVTTYPEEYWQIAAAVNATPGKALNVPFERRSSAMSWRGKFNHFKTKIVEQGFADTMLSLEEFNTLKALIVRIEPTYSGKDEKFHKTEPCTLILEHGDFTEVSLAVKAALGQSSPKAEQGAFNAYDRPPLRSPAAEALASERSKAEDAAALYFKAGAAPRPEWVCSQCSPDNMCWHKEEQGCNHE